MLFKTIAAVFGAVLFCQNCQPDHAASPAPKTMSQPLHFSNPSEKADSPAAPPIAAANHGSQQQTVASKKAKAEPIIDVGIFIFEKI
ncbi:MAG: hypothetical protein IPH31_09380 [Lewinellaceae bacterium]|nr:hypothetical protein [Lewinellaceae bacterium]